jgi:hypothetical protein
MANSEKYDKVMLNFSGGDDSLTAAYVLAGVSKELYLVTFKVFSETLLSLSKVNLEKLRRDFPDTKITHEILDMRPVQRKVLRSYFDSCEEFSRKWAPIGRWCFSCQMSMRVASVSYCLKNGIKVCADGAIKAEYFHASHKVAVVNREKKLFAGYGIRFVVPVYDFPEETRVFLKRKGYRIGREIYALKSTQPFCFFTFFQVVRQRAHRSATPEDVVAEYFDRIMPDLKNVIDGELDAFGIAKSQISPIGLPADFFVSAEGINHAELHGKPAAVILKFLLMPVYALFDLVIYLICQARKIFFKKAAG